MPFENLKFRDFIPLTNLCEVISLLSNRLILEDKMKHYSLAIASRFTIFKEGSRCTVPLRFPADIAGFERQWCGEFG